MWKVRNIHDGKIGIFGESSSRNKVIKRVYKLDTIPITNKGEKIYVCGEDGKSECRVDRENEGDIKYKMRYSKPTCNNGSITGKVSKVIEQYENLCDNSKLRILLLILIIFLII